MAIVTLKQDRDVDGHVAKLFRDVAAEYGFVPNILRALAHCPELLMTFTPFWATVYRSPTIGPRLRAFAALGTAHAQRCSYCVAHMSASATAAGLSKCEIEATSSPFAAKGALEDREQLIVEYADTLTRNPDGVTDELRSKLTTAFSESELVNVTVAIALYNLTSRFLKALRIDLEDVVARNASSQLPDTV